MGMETFLAMVVDSLDGSSEYSSLNLVPCLPFVSGDSCTSFSLYAGTEGSKIRIDLMRQRKILVPSHF